MTTLEELAAVVAQQRAVLDDLDQAVADLGATVSAAAAPAAADEPAEPVYADVCAFVEGIVAPLYASHSPAWWCARWQDHPDAVVRLEAVWRAWETLRLDPNLGMSKWLRDVADPQLDRLRDPDRGPFTACSGDTHLSPAPLPSSP